MESDFRQAMQRWIKDRDCYAERKLAADRLLNKIKPGMPVRKGNVLTIQPLEVGTVRVTLRGTSPLVVPFDYLIFT